MRIFVTGAPGFIDLLLFQSKGVDEILCKLWTNSDSGSNGHFAEVRTRAGCDFVVAENSTPYGAAFSAT